MLQFNRIFERKTWPQLGLAMLLAVANPLPGWVQSVKSGGLAQRQIWFEPPKGVILDDLGTPSDPSSGSRQAGGKRNDCPKIERPLTAIAPSLQHNSDRESVLGNAATDFPTFWFYVPYALTGGRAVELILFDEEGEEIYTSERLTDLGTAPGTLGFQPRAIALEPGKRYQWYFYVYCNPNDTQNYYLVRGWVKRVESEVDRATNLPPLERAARYGSAGIWYDPLAIVGEQLLAHPNRNNLHIEWSGLLQDIGLGEIASEPVQKLIRLEAKSSQPVTD